MTITLAGWVAPFGNPRIKACSRLPEAFRSVPRPSSPLDAKASTRCPSHTPPHPSDKAVSGQPSAHSWQTTQERPVTTMRRQSPMTGPRLFHHARSTRQPCPQGCQEKVKEGQGASHTHAKVPPRTTRKDRAGQNPSCQRTVRTHATKPAPRPRPCVTITTIRCPSIISAPVLREHRRQRTGQTSPSPNPHRPADRSICPTDQDRPRVHPPLGLRRKDWWARADLNGRPHAYQACALTS